MGFDVYSVGLNLKEMWFSPLDIQGDELFKQLIDISVPFYMNYILYGSSDFSYR